MAGMGLFAGILLMQVAHAAEADAKGEATEHGNHIEHGNLTEHGDHTEHGHHTEPVIAVLFPWFAQIIGVVAFFLLSRYLHAFPYTALMFIFGTFMGVGLARLHLTDQLTESLAMWNKINGELLLVAFLPGLLFKDAFCSNVHLIAQAMNQCLLFAFPMVLAGTVLTAIVAFYIFPYNWSWNLAMTLGAILAATDPVAVSALLEEVGAPPRLKVHISGESLLNDGSAVVFYTIFSALFLSELNIGLDKTIDGGEGTKIFFKMALGGFGIGVCFGLALLFILQVLDRRLNHEENVVQIIATISIAYLTFYVAEPVCHTSGVIAVVFCGFVTKAWGYEMINDIHVMERFWVLVEHILNSVLFALGGLVWGTVISNTNERKGMWEGRDWGYLILLYVLITVIRYILFYSCYPITSRIGLGTNLNETFFQCYGGLRGAVGIALAIQLDDLIYENSTDPTHRSYATKTFGMVGGIAFLTLIINGTCAGPLLKYLGLADEPKMRIKIIESYESGYKMELLESLMKLLTIPIYRNVNFAVVWHHVHDFKHVTADDIRQAVVHNKQNVPTKDYKEPYVAKLISFLDPTADVGDVESAHNSDSKDTDEVEKPIDADAEAAGADEVVNEGKHELPTSGIGATEEEAPQLLLELRKVFVELLRSAYHKMIVRGEIDARQGFVTYTLFEGLDFASDCVSKGGILNDFVLTETLFRSWTESFDRYLSRALQGIKKCITCSDGCCSKQEKDVKGNLKYEKVTELVHSAVALIRAHGVAEERFKKKFCSDGQVGDLETNVLEESQEQVRLAEEVLQRYEETDVIMSHLVCRILLIRGVRHVEHLSETGFLKEKEATEYMEEIQEELLRLYACPETHSEEQLCDDKKSS